MPKKMKKNKNKKVGVRKLRQCSGINKANRRVDGCRKDQIFSAGRLGSFEVPSAPLPFMYWLFSPDWLHSVQPQNSFLEGREASEAR